MCLILYANTPDACALITPEHIKDAWTGNPDGMGFAFRRGPNERVEIRKGFMMPRHAVQALQRIQALRPAELCVHWRYGTSGGTTPGNTHPFAMEHGALIHNGILSIRGTPRESDTRVAARLLFPLKPADLKEVLDTWCNGSRLLFMGHKKSQTWRTGNWYKTNLSPNIIMSQSYSLPNLAVRIPTPPVSIFTPGLEEEFDEWYAKRVEMGKTPSYEEENRWLAYKTEGPIVYRNGHRVPATRPGPGTVLRLPQPPALLPIATPITPPAEDCPTIGEHLNNSTPAHTGTEG